MSTEVAKPKIDYTKYNSFISTSQLDEWAKVLTVNAAGSSWFEKIYALAMLVAFAAYVYARARTVDNQMLIDKQQYNQDSLVDIHNSNNVL